METYQFLIILSAILIIAVLLYVFILKLDPPWGGYNEPPFFSLYFGVIIGSLMELMLIGMVFMGLGISLRNFLDKTYGLIILWGVFTANISAASIWVVKEIIKEKRSSKKESIN